MNFVPHTDSERKDMLSHLGLTTTEELFKDIPEQVRLKRELNLPPGLDEMSVRKEVTSLSRKNAHNDEFISFLGAGTYDHFRPALISHLLSRSEFYTAYTPYQPEISQGTLQAIFEFQTAVCELTGLDVANASMYDGATALAEAVVMAAVQTRRNKVLVSSTVHPEYRAVVKTYAWGRNIDIREIPYKDGKTDFAGYEELLGPDVAAVVIQNPNFFGGIEDLRQIIGTAADHKVMSIISADPVSLALLEAPGQLGADIVVGDGQALGIPPSFGGPHLGFMAAQEKYVRKMPGRIVGIAQDQRGQEGFVLTLQAREQHIRREKASSNICSNQALCALAATIYLSTMGKQGLKEVAVQSLCKADYAKNILNTVPGVEIAFPRSKTFQEFVVKTAEPLQAVNRRLREAGIIGGLDLGRFYPELTNHMLICVTETKSKGEIDLLKRVWEEKV
ncbi:MAG: aminomethyl-transferring glycine dehydrogenase subunit GcvPA [Peptococcaceae bacterium]